MPFPLFVFASSALAVATAGATLALSRRPNWAVVGALLGATALLVVHGLGFFRFFADDAYITLRYAEHLADGRGPNWNSEGRVEGYTNFLWMLTLAGFAKIDVDLVVTSQVLGILATLATFFIVYRIWQLWAREEPGSGTESPVLLALTLLAIALTSGTAFWGFSGMETPLFVALLTASAYRYFLERRGRGLPLSALALAAAAMTRPEGLIAAVVTGVFLFAAALPRAGRERALLRAVVWASVFALLYGSYFIWRYLYYDYLLPNTFYAKVGATNATFDRGLDYVWTWGLRYQLLPMLAGTALLLTQRHIRHDAAYVIVLSAMMVAGIVFEGGDDFPHARFITPLMALLYLGGLAGFTTQLKRLSLAPAAASLGAAAVLSLGALSLFRASHDLLIPIAVEREGLETRELLGDWLRRHTPSDYTIGAFAVGAIGYYSDRDILDLLGINDVHIAHTEIANFGGGLAGHEKYDADYVFDEVRPEIIIPNDAEPQRFTAEELRERFARPSIRARDAYLTDPRLWERYEVRSLHLEGKWFNFFQRRDTVAPTETGGASSAEATP